MLGSQPLFDRRYRPYRGEELIVPGAIGIGIGCVLAVAGLIIGGTLGYAAAGVGAVLLVAGILMLAIKKNNKELVEFVEKYSTDDTKSPKERLEDIKKKKADSQRRTE